MGSNKYLEGERIYDFIKSPVAGSAGTVGIWSCGGKTPPMDFVMSSELGTDDGIGGNEPAILPTSKLDPARDGGAAISFS